jgi:NTP pyrophosphatase (non-canonical NTP hydrolase)
LSHPGPRNIGPWLYFDGAARGFPITPAPNRLAGAGVPCRVAGIMSGEPKSDLQDLVDTIVSFRDERDWRQFHRIKDLVLSVGIEAGELMELTQWKSEAELETALDDDPEFRRRLGEEAADVLVYLLLVCEKAGIDLAAAAREKMKANAAKYPAEKARGTARKYTEL